MFYGLKNTKIIISIYISNNSKLVYIVPTFYEHFSSLKFQTSNFKFCRTTDQEELFKYSTHKQFPKIVIWNQNLVSEQENQKIWCLQISDVILNVYVVYYFTTQQQLISCVNFGRF